VASISIEPVQSPETSTIDLKSSPRTSVNSTNFQERKPSTVRLERQKLDHSVKPDTTMASSFQKLPSTITQIFSDQAGNLRQTVVKSMHSSPTTILPHQSSFAPSPPSFTYGSAQPAPAIASQSENFQIRESQPNTTRSPARSLLKKVNEYIKNKTDIHFKSANGSDPRKRPLDRCNNVVRLFSQAKLAFRWRGISGKILSTRLPGSHQSCEVADGHQEDFDDLWAC
jgi:hypothetical protein